MIRQVAQASLGPCNKIMRTAIALLLLIATAHGQSGKPPVKPVPKAGKNAFGKSYYLLNLPGSYTPARKYGLVLMLHGSGGRPENYAGWYGMATGKGYFHMLAASNDAAGYDEANDVPQIAAMVEEVVAAYSIDRDRILVSGHSAGGFASCYLIRKRPDLFTAAVPVSGCMPVTGDDVKHVPFFVVSGKKDFNNKQATQSVETMKAAGMDVTFLDPPEWDHNNVGDATAKAFAWFEALLPPDSLASLQSARAHLDKKAYGKAGAAAKKVVDAKAATAHGKNRAKRVIAEVDAAAEKELAQARSADEAGDTKKAVDVLTKAKAAFEGCDAAASIAAALDEYKKKLAPK